MWVVYVGALGRKGDILLVQIALTDDPHRYMVNLGVTLPYSLELIQFELGSPELLEIRRGAFKAFGLRNGWFLAKEPLMKFIGSLPKVDISEGAPKKICVDFSPSEAQEIADGVERLGTRTQARLIRRAVKFYLRLSLYKAKGWTVQVIRGGRFEVFPDLDDIDPPQD